ncbi:hybrid sensor histidine kinase/response regulator [Ideonella sp. YS5]|uniref:hybrid sensor histidine kinase/response regulator n=1 Tax=Ideonella sp. YS5 TaxID=3453714 RepID=UPI003EEF4A88
MARLTEDVARLTHSCEAVLSCGTQVIARWSEGTCPREVIATQPFLAGAETYELNLYGEHARPLTERECGVFQAMTGALRRALESEPAIVRPHTGADQVKDHISAALDYVTDAFVLVLKDWTVEHVNTQFERTVRRRRADILGRSLWEVFPQLAGTRFETEARAAIGGTVARLFEAFSEPLARWFECRAYPCKEGLAILAIDITERKSEGLARADIEQKLLQAQRMESLGTLASGIAHDFNNILGAILGNVGLLRHEVSLQGLEYLEQVQIAGQRARELVQQILTHSRATTREFMRQPLRPLVEDSLQLLRSTLPAAVQLLHTLSDEPLAATFDPSEVHQVVMNLCTNAWQALPPEGGTIHVALQPHQVESRMTADIGQLDPGLYARLVVSDNGAGMTPDTRRRLFEPFFTTKPRGQGTGLGLHVLSGIVTAHGGAVIVQSQPGQGSRFEVYLPATPTADVEAAPAPQVTPTQAGGERVAYVDDDEVVQMMVHRVLERAGFQVTSFHAPDELLAAVRNDANCFDLLVTDFSMPGMNGLQVARQVRALCPAIPIIIATGYVSEDLREAAAELGRTEILNKERTFEELGERATRAIGIGLDSGDRA